MVHPVRRDAFFASPKFPRLLSADAIRDTIVRASPMVAGLHRQNRQRRLQPFAFNQAIMTADIEFSEEMFLITERQPKLT